MKQVFEGLSVLDFSSGFAGSLAAAMLADYGAKVVKIEPPQGSASRQLEPMIHDVSLAHNFVNRGKKSIMLDLDREDHLKVAKSLIATADVLVEDGAVGQMDTYGLDYESAKLLKDNITYCSITPYGQKGPYAHREANEHLLQTIAGVVSITGELNGRPKMHAFPMAEYAGAYAAYSGILLSLIESMSSHKGQYIDISKGKSLFFMNSAIERTSEGIYSGGEGNHHPTIAPYGIFEGNNGQSVIICALSAGLWKTLCTLMGIPEYINDPRFSEVHTRSANRLELAEVIEKWLKSFDDLSEAVQLLDDSGIPTAQIFNIDNVLSDEHIKQAGWVQEIKLPILGEDITFYAPASSFTLEKNPAQTGKAPALGENTEECLDSIGHNN